MTDDVFPDRSMALREKIEWMIETNGWAVQPVPPYPDADPPIPGYTYTIGFESSFGYPEVVVFGLQPVAARGLLGLVVEFLESGTHPPVGAVFTGLLDNDLRCALLAVDADEAAELFETANAWYGSTAYRVAQLVWPDRNGWLPWESGFDMRLALAQPLVGSIDDLS